MNYKNKYLKYKNKYLKLFNKYIGGSNKNPTYNNLNKYLEYIRYINYMNRDETKTDKKFIQKLKLSFNDHEKELFKNITRKDILETNNVFNIHGIFTDPSDTNDDTYATETNDDTYATETNATKTNDDTYATDTYATETNETETKDDKYTNNIDEKDISAYINENDISAYINENDKQEDTNKLNKPTIKSNITDVHYIKTEYTKYYNINKQGNYIIPSYDLFKLYVEAYHKNHNIGTTYNIRDNFYKLCKNTNFIKRFGNKISDYINLLLNIKLSEKDKHNQKKYFPIYLSDHKPIVLNKDNFILISFNVQTDDFDNFDTMYKIYYDNLEKKKFYYYIKALNICNIIYNYKKNYPANIKIIITLQECMYSLYIILSELLPIILDNDNLSHSYIFQNIEKLDYTCSNYDDYTSYNIKGNVYKNKDIIDNLGFVTNDKYYNDIDGGFANFSTFDNTSVSLPMLLYDKNYKADIIHPDTDIIHPDTEQSILMLKDILKINKPSNLSGSLIRSCKACIFTIITDNNIKIKVINVHLSRKYAKLDLFTIINGNASQLLKIQHDITDEYLKTLYDRFETTYDQLETIYDSTHDMLSDIIICGDFNISYDKLLKYPLSIKLKQILSEKLYTFDSTKNNIDWILYLTQTNNEDTSNDNNNEDSTNNEGTNKDTNDEDTTNNEDNTSNEDPSNNEDTNKDANSEVNTNNEDSTNKNANNQDVTNKVSKKRKKNKKQKTHQEDRQVLDQSKVEQEVRIDTVNIVDEEKNLKKILQNITIKKTQIEIIKDENIELKNKLSNIRLILPEINKKIHLIDANATYFSSFILLLNTEQLPNIKTIEQTTKLYEDALEKQSNWNSLKVQSETEKESFEKTIEQNNLKIINFEQQLITLLTELETLNNKIKPLMTEQNINNIKLFNLKQNLKAIKYNISRIQINIDKDIKDLQLRNDELKLFTKDCQYTENYYKEHYIKYKLNAINKTKLQEYEEDLNTGNVQNIIDKICKKKELLVTDAIKLHSTSILMELGSSYAIKRRMDLYISEIYVTKKQIEQLNNQIKQLNKQFNKLNTEKEKITNQIQKLENLNK